VSCKRIGAISKGT